MYKNPIIPGVNPDPSICRVDTPSGSDYYLATSTFSFIPGVPIYHSHDLIHWRLIGHALTSKEHFRLDHTITHQEIYAPTLRYHQGTFYMVTTNVHGGGNFFVTASDPAGEWSDPIFIDDGAFDPSLFFDDDGKVYYTRRGPFATKDIVQAEINLSTGKLLTPLRSISLGLVSDDAEGPHLYKIDGWYYLMIAEGGSMYLHMETIGRSRSPWGPFDPCPWNPILSQHHAWWHPVRSTGHADLVEAHDGSWWMVFLATRHASYPALNIIGRESFLARVHWQDGWPVVDRRATRNLEVDAATLPPRPWGLEPTRDDFLDDAQLSARWVSTSFPDSHWFSLRERRGHLRLWGQPDLPGEGRPAAFFGQRQTAFHSQASTQLEFEPASENEEAGIVIFMSADYQYLFTITRRGGKRVVILRRIVGDIHHEETLAEVPEGAIRLKVSSEPETYTFSWWSEEGGWNSAGTALTRFLSTEMARTWSGLLVGMYACGNGKVCTQPADFDWFEYEPEERKIEAFY